MSPREQSTVTGLAGPHAYGVVIGTGRHPQGSGLPDLPGAPRSAAAMAEVLGSVCGMNPDHIQLLTDPANPTDVLAAVERATTRVPEDGIVVFFFAGHGLLGPEDGLYLATAASASADSTAYAVPYDEVRKLLSASPASPVVILDCCFSGLAEAASQGARRDPYLAARPIGSFLLTSATYYAASFAPEGARYTLFSGELLRLLTEGDTAGPKRFTLGDVYRHLDQRFHGGPARPHADGVGRVGDLVIAPNPRYALAPGPEPLPHESGGVCPYPGMRPFLPEERHLFFGRAELTRALLDRAAPTAPPGPVVLVGPSGVGKSSLLRAGLGASPEVRRPVLLLPAPGAAPFRELVAQWADAVGRPFGEIAAELGAGRFPAPAEDSRRAPGVLIVDQMEEIFTQCQDPEERDLFIRSISARHDDGPRIVLGLRADYYGHFLGDPRLARILRDGQFTVAPMTDDELLSVIRGPADHAGLQLEDGLAELLLRDLWEQDTSTGGDAIALPFLAHALQETWTRRRHGRMTVSGYHSTGGIRGSVAQTAERVHASLEPADRPALRALLLRLVHLVGAEGKAVRRRVRTDDLVAAANERDRQRNTVLLGRLTDARLVVVDDDRAQLCHDSLLYGWPALRSWINENLEALLAHRSLAEAADAWDEAGRPPSGLYTGKHLTAVRNRIEDGGRILELRGVERDFLAASVSARRRDAVRLRTGVSLLVALALVLGFAVVRANRASDDAEHRKAVETARELVARADELRERDPLAAFQLSLAAYRMAQVPETRTGLYASYVARRPTVLAGASRVVLNLAFSPDGRSLAATLRRGEKKSGQPGQLALWDLGSASGPRPEAVVPLGEYADGNATLAHHPRKPIVAVQNAERLTVWDVSDLKEPRKLAERSISSHTTFSLAFSPDGRTLAAGRKDGLVRLWDLTDPARPVSRREMKAADTDVISIAFSRDGRYLTTGNGRSDEPGKEGAARPANVRLWDVRDPARPVLRDTAEAPSVTAVAYHPERDLVSAVGADGLRWWSVGPEGKLTAISKGEYGAQWGGGSPSLAFRPDGKVLAAADNNGSSALMREVGAVSELTSTLAALPSYPASEPVQSVAWSPDGKTLAAGDFRGEIRLWRDRSDAPSVPGTPPGLTAEGRPYSRDGKLLLTEPAEQARQRAKVWDVTGPNAPRVRFELPRLWEGEQFLPGRKKPVLLSHLWTEGMDYNAFRMWEFGTEPGSEPVPGREFRFHGSDVLPSLGPDGTLLALGGTRGTVELWDIRDIHQPRKRGEMTVPLRALEGILWWLDSRTLAVREKDDLRLWDVADPARPAKAALIKDAYLHSGAAYIRSAQILMTEESGGELRLWDMSDMKHPVEGDRLPAAPTNYFQLKRRELATVLASGQVLVWDVTDPSEVRRVDSLRLEREIKSVTTSPDGKWVVTEQPYRLWKARDTGRWETPAYLELPFAQQVGFLPGERPRLLVTPGDTSGSGGAPRTFLLDLDPDAVYERLCRTRPANIGRAKWNELFPHLAYQRSCT
ncbi:caspase family protein [Streptomyces sp. NPDC059426]|uniref:caspase, EACC1-associated type n=1 Tax=Streptomyces sp. NPDC059426 TaxID=3346827 RepID=UPI0036CCD788